MSNGNGDGDQQASSRLRDQLPTEQLTAELRELAKLSGRRALRAVTGTGRSGSTGGAAGLASAVKDQVTDQVKGQVTGQAKDHVTDTVKEGVKGKGKQAVESAKSATDKAAQATQAAQPSSASSGPGTLTNIVEEIDVGVPLRVAYDQWTSFSDFPSFMKQVEEVSDVSDTELKWRGRVLWSRRDWTTEIVEQVPYERLIWKSEGSKGRVEGAVSFHEITPNLTKILLVLEYYPQGLFEKTANLWRAQGRRARLELKHFRRHVMTQTALHPDEVEGRRSTIHEGEVQDEPSDSAQSQEAEASSEHTED